MVEIKLLPEVGVKLHWVSNETFRTWLMSIPNLAPEILTFVIARFSTGASGSPQIIPQYELLWMLDEYDGAA